MIPLVTPSRAPRSRAEDGGGDAAQDESRIEIATANKGRYMWTPIQDMKSLLCGTVPHKTDTCQ
jgi:hypothetical protein